MILELHAQGMSVSAIARKLDLDRKTVRKYIARGAEAPVYGPRAARPTKLEPYRAFLADRMRAFPGLSAVRLLREIRVLGYAGGYTGVKEALQEMRPARALRFEHRFETAPGEQAQVDFAQFRACFAIDPEEWVTLWLFTLVLGHSRYLWGRFFFHADLLTLLHAHRLAFEALGGVPREILYDRMKAAVLNEAIEGVIYNAKLQALARHYGFTPRACAAYRAKTKGKVERPYRYIRQDFYLGRRFQDLEDLNRQFDLWRNAIANRRRHGTTHHAIGAAFAAEQPSLLSLPALAFDTVLALERHLSHDGMVSINGNLYSVPDGVRGHIVEARVSLKEVQIYAAGSLVAAHPRQDGRHQRILAPGHRHWPPPGSAQRHAGGGPRVLAAPGQSVRRRPLEVYERIGATLAGAQP